MGRKVNKLFDLEFDEVSSVDRPANQHGLIAFSKAANAADMIEESRVTDLYTDTGLPVDEDDLEHGDTVFDEAGNEFVFVADDEDDDDEIGKALSMSGLRTAANQFKTGMKGEITSGPSAEGAAKLNPMAQRVGFGARKNGKKIAAGTAAGVGVGGGGAYMMRDRDGDGVGKSLGDSVLEQLSKAVSESDREFIIAKALDEVEIAKSQAQAAQDELAMLQDERVTEAFIAKAAEYNLPVHPGVFGPILKAAASVLTDEELDILDHVLTAAGDAIYDEVGLAGGASNSIYDRVNGLASEMVTKSAGDFSLEQASTAMFAANPDAYDAYISEQNGW
jgi:hypothetical protein